VDLLVLDGAPLELAGRVAVGGRLLFEDDPAERVRWEAMTSPCSSASRAPTGYAPLPRVPAPAGRPARD
jgi:hypothetical protein